MYCCADGRVNDSFLNKNETPLRVCSNWYQLRMDDVCFWIFCQHGHAFWIFWHYADVFWIFWQDDHAFLFFLSVRACILNFWLNACANRVASIILFELTYIFKQLYCKHGSCYLNFKTEVIQLCLTAGMGHGIESSTRSSVQLWQMHASVRSRAQCSVDPIRNSNCMSVSPESASWRPTPLQTGWAEAHLVDVVAVAVWQKWASGTVH